MLENRLGATYFLIVYLASAVGGGIASIEGHSGAFLTVGASGAISGIVGALLCLTILGKLPLTLQFFMVVIGINVLFSMNAAHVDWLAHLGGFTAGFAVCALLDTAENLNRYWLRCKFPEFVKSGIAAGFLAAALLYFEQGGQDGIGPLVAAAGAIAGLVIAIKLADIVLARPRGLAVMTVAAAVFWGFLGYAAGAVAAHYQLYSGIQLYGILPSAEAFREHIGTLARAHWPPADSLPHFSCFVPSCGAGSTIRASWQPALPPHAGAGRAYRLPRSSYNEAFLKQAGATDGRHPVMAGISKGCKPRTQSDAQSRREYWSARSRKSACSRAASRIAGASPAR